MPQDISVVIVAKDEQNYIRKTLESIAAQKLSPIELSVVDGYSRDATVSIAVEFGAKIFYEDRSIALARNLGARNATGDIIVFVDADTELPDYCLVYVSDFFSNNTSIVGLCGKVAPKDTPSDNSFFNRIIIAIFYNLTTRLSFLFGRPHVTGVFMAFRKNNFLKIGGFREDLYLGEDTEIYRKLSYEGKTRYLPKIMAYTSMRRFSKRPLYWLGFWLLNSIVYELCGRIWHKKYPRVD